MSDDHNPTRPTPHGTPDRRYIDRSLPRQAERIQAAELAKLVEEFVPVYCRRVGINPPKPKSPSPPDPESFEFKLGDYPNWEGVPMSDLTKPDTDGDDFDLGEQ